MTWAVKRYPRRGMVAMYSALSEAPFNVRRSTKICWLRFASSTNVSAHSVLSSSSFDTTRSRQPDQERQNVERFGGHGLWNAVAEQGALAGSRRNGPNSNAAIRHLQRPITTAPSV